MKSDLPKVIHPLQGKPLILYVIESLNSAGIKNIIVVIGYKGEMVIDTVGPCVDYVWQHEQLGTGHAVLQAEDELKNFSGQVIVACGDVPLIKAGTFKSLIEKSNRKEIKSVVLTMKVKDPTGYGRVLKDKQDNFTRIVEEKDASPEEKLITEVNTGTYIFDKEFLFLGLKHVDCNNMQGEYYLPDALEYIIKCDYSVETLLLNNPIEGSGINSKDDLISLEPYINK